MHFQGHMQGRGLTSCMILAGGAVGGLVGGLGGQKRGRHIPTCGASTHEGSPPPSVVLNCQLEVGERNGDEGRDNDKDDEDDEEDGVDGVHLVAPHAGKDVVQLNVDGTEWQKACSMSFKASEHAC